MTLWTAAHQTSLSFTISQSLLKLMSIELVMPSNHLISVIPLSSCLQSFPASGSFPVSWFFESGGQSIGASASAWVLPMTIQGWFPLGWTGLILLSKWLPRVFSSTSVFHLFLISSFITSPSLVPSQMFKKLTHCSLAQKIKTLTCPFHVLLDHMTQKCACVCVQPHKSSKHESDSTSAETVQAWGMRVTLVAFSLKFP